MTEVEIEAALTEIREHLQRSEEEGQRVERLKPKIAGEPGGYVLLRRGQERWWRLSRNPLSGNCAPAATTT